MKKKTHTKNFLYNLLKNMDIFNKFCEKPLSEEDKFWSLLTDYHHIIPKIYGLPKTWNSSTTNYFWNWNIAKSLAKTLSFLLGMISNSHIKKLRGFTQQNQ